MSRASNQASTIDDGTIRAAIAPYKIDLTDEQVARIRAYIALLVRWNRAIGLTTITAPAEMVGRHFGESMFAANLLPVENCRLADVGSGAGFPGLALKIYRPGVHLTLIESVKKKCAFLSEVVRELGLGNVEVRPARFEEIRPEGLMADIITSRALGDFRQLMSWSEQALVNRGHLVLWLGMEDSTRLSATRRWTWQPAVRIPESQRRFILIGRPIREI